VQVPITGASSFLETGFTIVGNTIRCDFTGRVRVSGSVSMFTTTIASIVNMQALARINGGAINGSTGACSVGTTAIPAAICNIPTRYVDVVTNDVLDLFASRIAGAAGSIVQLASRSGFLVERVV
jgi:hypothetical protein